MECICLGDVYEEEVEDLVECKNLKEPFVGYDRNYELFKNFNLGGFYYFLTSVTKSLRLGYFSSSRPTRLESDSNAREVFKTVKNMFSQKRRRLTFNLGRPGVMNRVGTTDTNSLGKCVTLHSNFDFFVDDKNVILVSVYEGKNLRVTTIPTTPDNPVTKLSNGKRVEFEPSRKVPFKTFVILTGRNSSVTTLTVNDSFGFWFEVFVGFSDKAVAFFRVNTKVGLMNGNEEEFFNCSNVSDFLYLDEVPVFSKFSPNREMVLVATKTAVYLLEKSGLDIEYEKLCEYKPGSFLCAHFLNDLEVLVMEQDFTLTVYKKQELKFNRFIQYNLHTLISDMPRVTSKRNPNLYLPENRDFKGRQFGKFVKDYTGNIYLLVKNMNLVKLAWNESMLPYCNSVTFQTPENLNQKVSSQGRGVQRFAYNFNVENNMVAVTFTGSNLVHLYSLTSFNEIHQLMPPKPDYLPKFVASSTNNNRCYLVVLWSHKSNFNTCLDENYQELFEKNLHNLDVLRTYKIRSTLTKTFGEQEEDLKYYTGCFNVGYDAEHSQKYFDYPRNRYSKLPPLSSLHPKIRSSLHTRLNDYDRFDDSFHNRRNLFGRSVNEGNQRRLPETIYTLDEFIRNRGK